jgi:hypothetical protein
MNRADRWLHGELRAIRRWRIRSLDDVQSLEGARAGLDALEVAGAVSAASTARWRVILAREAGGERRVVVGPEVSARAERLLGDLLDALGPDVDRDVAGVLRFESAVEVFSAVAPSTVASGGHGSASGVRARKSEPRSWAGRRPS